MEENRIVRPLEDPLQNADILEQVLENLPKQDLLQTRLVSKFWLESSAKAMRSCVHVILNCQENASALSEFLEVAEATKRIFSRAPDVGTYSLLAVQTYDERFWTLCGRIRSLHMCLIRFPSADAFRHAIFQSCPRLEELHLEHVYVDGDQAEEPLKWVPPRFPQNENLKLLNLRFIRSFGISWMEIFSQFPSLQEMEVSDIAQYGDKFFRSLAFARMENLESLELKRLRIDRLRLKNIEEISGLLVQANFSLEALDLSELSDPFLTQMILTTQTSTLKKLRLTITSRHPDIFPLPNNALLEKLTEFKLEGSRLRSLRFLRSMPNLKRFELSNSLVPSIINNEFVFEYHEPDKDPWAIISCTELELNAILCVPFKVDDLRYLHKRLPNIEKLSISMCSNELLTVVCEYWSHVTSLKLYNSDVDYSGISGLDAEDIKRMSEDIDWKPVTVRRANLSSLKNLKSFFADTDDDDLPIENMLTPRRLFVDGFLHDNWEIDDDRMVWNK